MSRFLRIIRRGGWRRHPHVPWLQPGELQANVFRDAQPEDNAISVYRADSDEDAAKIAIAIAATRGNFGNIDYAIIEESELTDIGITPIQIDGATPSSDVNRLHFDLKFLTMDKIIQLVHAIARAPHRRVDAKTVRILIRAAFQDGGFDDHDKINPDILAKLHAA